MIIGTWFRRRGDPIRRFVKIAGAVALCWTILGHADTGILSVNDGSATATSGQPGTIVFPVTRSSGQTYDAVLGYHAVDGSAVGGADYRVPPGTLTIPAAATNAAIAVALNPDTRSGKSISFHLQLDNASRIGPVAAFATNAPFVTGNAPVAVTSADVNGDGKADLIVANQSDDTVSVFLNITAAGATTPSFATQQPFATGAAPVCVTAADVNGDGRPDLIVTNAIDDTISVLLNITAAGATTPSFAAQKTFATGTDPSYVAAIDVNGDGKADLIVANSNDFTGSVLLNLTVPGAATPSFAAQTPFNSAFPKFVASADVNGDGRPDLIVLNMADTVSVLLNTTAPGAATVTFSAEQTFATGALPTGVAAADLNGDGRPDLIVANLEDDTVSVLLNTTAPGAAMPTFAAQQTFATGSQPDSVTVIDVNGDGKPDLIAANFNGNVSVLVNSTAPGAAAPSFLAQQTFAAGLSPWSITTTDINGDGRPDLIAVNHFHGAVSVLLNTTAPDSTPPVFAAQQPFAVGALPAFATAADVNGDGKLDLIVANDFGDTVSVLLNTTAPGAATPSFASQQTFATELHPLYVTAADLNGDGKPDLIVANLSAGSVSVLLNTTAPGATASSFASQQPFDLGLGSLPNSVVVADINGDGKPDVITVLQAPDLVSVLLNTTAPGATTPTFAAQKVFDTGHAPRAVASADLNGDGKPDLIVANNLDNTVSVLLNTTAPGAATPAFAAQTTFATQTGPISIATADIDGDGRRDLIVANNQSNSVSVLLNTTAPGAATASFSAQHSFATGASPDSVTTADVDGDGRPDLIAANNGDHTVSLLLDTTAPGAATPSFANQQTFATASGNPASIAAADVNGDGKADLIAPVDGADAVSVLLNATYFAPFAINQATGTIGLDKIFHNGVERPEVQCTGTTSQADALIEDFAGSNLDLLRWNANSNRGTVTVAGNSVSLSSSLTQFPFISSRETPIPATGDFSIRWNATYTGSGSHGDGSLVISRELPANAANDNYALRRADVWQDTNNGYQVRQRSADVDPYTAILSEKPPLLGAHDIEYCWLSSTIEIWVDGTRVLQQPRGSGLSRPDRLWFGNPVVSGAGGWNSFTLRSIHVRSVSP